MVTRQLVLLLLIAATVHASINEWDPECIQEPVGFGKGTYGGEGGKVVVPKTLQELKKSLSGDTPRIILLNQTFDFTGDTIIQDGCFFKKCGEGFQYSLTVSDTCDGREPTQVELDNAGLTPLNIGSFKTIVGINGRGVIRGKGLKIRHAQQVIIRDISIVDINPHVIWGGDALAINGVDQAWIHNVTFKNIGRQFIVTYQTSNTGVTISSCTFDGSTTNSAFCDGNHYWVWLFWGTDDRITLINNKIINTSGRLPHAGGYDQAKSYIHIVGNFFETNTDVALEPWDGSYLLVEGNVFSNMVHLVNERAKNGNLYLVSTPQQSIDCIDAFGELCLPNQYQETKRATWANKNVLLEAVKTDFSVKAINDARSAVCLYLTGYDDDISNSSSSSSSGD